MLRSLKVALLLYLSVAGVAASTTLSGSSGPDLLVGGESSDTLKGGEGDDRLIGDPSLRVDGPTAITRILGNNGAVPTTGSFDTALSGNGRYIVFSSAAPEYFAPGKANDISQIWLYEVDTGLITLVSASSDGGPGNGASAEPTISADGRYIAFTSKASNLNFNGLAGDGVHNQIILKDMSTGNSFVVSRNNIQDLPNNGSSNPILSQDGTLLAFISKGSDIVVGDSNNFSDYFILKTSAYQSVYRLSARIDGSEITGGGVWGGSFSPDGSRFAFSSGGTNIPDNPNEQTNGTFIDVFIKEISTFDIGSHAVLGGVSLLSGPKDGVISPDGESDYPLFSPDGRNVFFVSTAIFDTSDTNGPSPDIYARTIADGDAYPKGSVRLVSSAMTGKAGNGIVSPEYSLSADGSRLLFASTSTDLLPIATNGNLHTFVKDLVEPNGKVALLSRKPGEGAEAALGASGAPLAAPDGTFVAYTSSSTDLVGGGAASGPHIYIGAMPKNTGGDDILDGGLGADLMEGGRGNDIYFVDDLGDKIVEEDGQGQDSIQSTISMTMPARLENLTLIGNARNGTGNATANVIIGNKIANKLNGAGGPDELTGGGGADLLAGGPGRDIFVYRRISDSPAGKAKRDTIVDFDARGRETIDLSLVDADSRRKGRQHFSFIGSTGFSGKRGELRFVRGRLLGDTDGDRKPEFEIRVKVVRGTFSARNLKLR